MNGRAIFLVYVPSLRLLNISFNLFPSLSCFASINSSCEMNDRIIANDAIGMRRYNIKVALEIREEKRVKEFSILQRHDAIGHRAKL